ncbi:hypothetical protein D1BOALGB6SA_4358 [Olavius sp. associated proteobacterium Delta 1]|nr:hypothetical protein D1BOALGB6SA_4358 [Olavius sp. associated proteobacterium Delta 1]
MRGTVCNVVENKGSENAQQGDILFGRVAQIDSLAMLIGCGTIRIPPKMKPEVIRFREWLLESYDSINSDTLYDYDLEIRQLYFDIYYILIRPPELRNTDGDPHFSSPEIFDMFRVYETEDGFLIPGSALDNLNDQWDEKDTQSVSSSQSAVPKPQRLSGNRAKKPSRDSRKKDVDDRQLKLFDDE